MSNLDSAYQSGWRNWFSGTNSHVSAVINAPYGSGITGATLYLNGTVVRSFANVPPQQPPPSIRFDVNFDSTHFGDGTQIDVRVEANSSNGGHADVTQSAPAYNKAFVFGNDINFGGDLPLGWDAMNYVNARIDTTNHTIMPPGVNLQLTQSKSAIIAAIPAATVFYGWIHGADSGQFGDSSAHGNDSGAQFTEHWLSPYTDVYNAVTSKDPTTQPPYNFVFVDSCSAGATSALSDNFRIPYPSSTDRASIGWELPMYANQHNLNWTNRLFQKLSEGLTLRDAIDWADDLANGGPAIGFNLLTQEQETTTPARYGDLFYKLHGVYGGAGLQWFL